MLRSGFELSLYRRVRWLSLLSKLFDEFHGTSVGLISLENPLLGQFINGRDEVRQQVNCGRHWILDPFLRTS